MADKLIVGPAESPATPSLKITGAKTTNGEAGYKKRDGGRFPEVNREVNDRFPKPTRK